VWQQSRHGVCETQVLVSRCFMTLYKVLILLLVVLSHLRVHTCAVGLFCIAGTILARCRFCGSLPIVFYCGRNGCFPWPVLDPRHIEAVLDQPWSCGLWSWYWCDNCKLKFSSFSALTLLVGRRKGQLACKSSATTIPKSLVLGTDLTWSSSMKIDRLNKNWVSV